MVWWFRWFGGMDCLVILMVWCFRDMDCFVIRLFRASVVFVVRLSCVFVVLWLAGLGVWSFVGVDGTSLGLVVWSFAFQLLYS